MPKIDPATPNHVVRELATRWHAELTEDDAGRIKRPIAAEGYDVDEFAGRFGAALGLETSSRGEQGALKEFTHAATRRVTRSTVEATAYVRGAALRGEALIAKGLDEGHTLVALARARYLPPEGGSYKDVTATLDNLIPFFRTLGEQALPGLPPSFRDRAAALRATLLAELRGEEKAETVQEDATLDAREAGDVLRALCEEYLAMRAVAEDVHGPLPGGDLGVLEQWEATRPGAVAARTAAPPVVDGGAA